MIRFESDYLEGAVPEIMSRLIETNYEQTAGYGTDPYCRAAREKIKLECNAFDADIHFLVGGTQANLTVIAAALRPHQGVMAAETAHIEAHETGAIEATGHKVITLPTTDGKINAADVKNYVLRHRADESFEHIVQPAMVYISQPTETGTVYSLPELEELSSVCRELGLILFADGARLSCALACEGTPTLSDLARLCDVFYIGGTKHGALFGEAVVIKNDAIKKDFRYIISSTAACSPRAGYWVCNLTRCLRTDCIIKSAGARSRRLRSCAPHSRQRALSLPTPRRQISCFRY